MDLLAFEVLLIAAAVASVLFFLVTSDPEAFDLDATALDEMHHLYIGFALLAAGLIVHESAFGLALRVVGVVLMVDDAFQHAWRTFMRDPWYISGLTRAYWWLAKRSFALRWLNSRADYFVWWLFDLFRRN